MGSVVVSLREAPALTEAERKLLETIRALRFASIEAVVHDGRLARIEKVEKFRFDLEPDPGAVEAAGRPTQGEPPRRRSASGGIPGDGK